MLHELTERILGAKGSYFDVDEADAVIRQYLTEKAKELRNYTAYAERDTLEQSEARIAEILGLSEPLTKTEEILYNAVQENSMNKEEVRWVAGEKIECGDFVYIDDRGFLMKIPKEKTLAEKLQESVKDWKGGDNAPLFWDTLAKISQEHFNSTNRGAR